LPDVFELMRRVSQDGSGLAGIAIDEDECGTLDAVVPLPIDPESDIGFFDMDGFGLPIALGDYPNGMCLNCTSAAT
jgi:hypothetical protein